MVEAAWWCPWTELPSAGLTYRHLDGQSSAEHAPPAWSGHVNICMWSTGGDHVLQTTTFLVKLQDLDTPPPPHRVCRNNKSIVLQWMETLYAYLDELWLLCFWGGLQCRGCTESLQHKVVVRGLTKSLQSIWRPPSLSDLKPCLAEFSSHSQTLPLRVPEGTGRGPEISLHPRCRFSVGKTCAGWPCF